MSHTCRATKDGRVMVESSDKTCCTGEGNGKPLQCSHLKNLMNSMENGGEIIYIYTYIYIYNSLCYTPETNTILYVNFIFQKKLKISEEIFPSSIFL